MIAFLIHEQPSQLTGSDCCGKIEGKYTDFKPEPLFEKTRKSLENAEMIMAMVREYFPEVEVHQIDSRNIFGIWMMMWKYRKTLQLPLRKKLQFFFLFFRIPCLILDGHYFELDVPGVELKIEDFLKSLKEQERASYGKI